MSATDLQPVKQEPCRLRDLVRTVALIVLVLSATARAATAPRPELPQPEEAPLFVQPSPIGDVEYRTARGLKLGDSGFTLGGFGTVAAIREEGRRGRFGLRDLDLFVFFDPTAYLHAFADFAFDRLFDIDDSGKETSANADASVVRLYADLNLGDRANFRLGKFLTPFGRWNQIPAEPLVWTTSRPLVTNGPFDEQVTGAEFWGTLFPPGGSLTYAFYGQFLPALPIRATRPPAADDSAGARLEFTALGGWSAGASYFAFSRRGLWNHLGGCDALWRNDRVELSGELLGGRGNPDGHSIFGLYVQAVVRIAEDVHVIGRYEHFDPGSPLRALDSYDLGLAWRPISFLILKADYLFANHTSSPERPGVRASMSLLF